MHDLSVVHNIPSPYRLYLFRLMSRRLAARGRTLHVHFMARGHEDRPHWGIGVDDDLGFAATFWSDHGPHVHGKCWHLNPGLLATLRRSPPRHLMIGGPWDSLTGLLSTLSLSATVSKIAWIEGNTKTPGRVTGAIRAAKAALLRHFDAVAVPGEEGRRYASLICGGHPPPLVVLPNLVDERRFTGPVALAPSEVRRRFGLNPEGRVALWNARLIPEKGILEFFSALTPSDLVGWEILLLGQGPLEAEVRRVLDERGLTGKVHLLPYVPYDEMPQTYRASDLFLLPSRQDPNPLSIVEALHAGLPLLVSDRIGNLPEALQEGRNGWSFSPGNPGSLRRAIDAAFRVTPDTLRLMGVRSAALAQQHWTSEPAVDAFFSAIGL